VRTLHLKPALCGLLLLCAHTARADGGRVFDALWETVRDRYAYFAEVQPHWDCVRDTLRPQAVAASERGPLLDVMERTLETLTDFHSHMNVNNERSWRLVPSGTDVWAEMVDGAAIVRSVRPRAPAARMGIRADDEIVSINDVPIAEALRTRTPVCVDAKSPQVQRWALLSLLAGRRDQARKLTVRHVDGRVRALWLAPAPTEAPHARARLREDNVAIIAISELGSEDTIRKFDLALERYRHARALIIDLRETANGGNTDVAEPILGRFIQREAAYQMQRKPDGTLSPRTVAPRGPFSFDKPVAVVVGRWTASMGEGMAIGLNALRAAPVVGTPMAGLRASVDSFTLPETGWRFNLPTVPLAHVNGTPREQFVPTVPGKTDYGGDAVFSTAVRALRLTE
jgi:carboxyl-terminal processing protease